MNLMSPAGARPVPKHPSLLAVNTALGNIETSLSDPYHAFGFRKCAHRYLGQVQNLFNRQFNLREVLDRLARAASQALPCPLRTVDALNYLADQVLFYVDEFPEKRHHRKKTELRFPKLRARAPQACPVLDQLDGEHGSGEKSIQHLGHMLLGFEMIGEPRRQAFKQAAERCVSFYLGHMELEEQNILPISETALSNADWAEFDQAFAGNRDPLTGHEPVANYRALFTRIVNIVPAPVGLGAARP